MKFNPTFDALHGAFLSLDRTAKQPAFGLETRSKVGLLKGDGVRITAQLNQMLVMAIHIVFQAVEVSDDEIATRYPDLFLFSRQANLRPTGNANLEIYPDGNVKGDDQGAIEAAWDRAFHAQLKKLVGDLEQQVIEPELVFQGIKRDASRLVGKREPL